MAYYPPPPPGTPPPGGYGPPPGGYGPGEPPADQGLVIGSLVAGAVGLLAICVMSWMMLPLPIAAVVLGIIAVAQRESSPKTARTCAIIAYACVGAGIVLGVLLWVLMFVWWGGAWMMGGFGY